MKHDEISEIDFDRIWQRIAEELPASPPPVEGSGPRLGRGLAVAMTAFVMVLIGGVALASLQARRASNPSAEPDAATAATQGGAEAAVVLPATVPDRDSFELVWQMGDGSAGRIIWESETMWRADRTAITTTGPAVVYSEGREGTNRFRSTPEGVDDDSWSLVQDTSIPYKMVLKPHSVADAWEQLGGEVATATTPEHPLATMAVTDGTLTVEFDATGLPIAISSSDGRFAEIDWVVASLEYRPIHREEYQAPDISVMYAAYLLTDAPTAQQALLADGFVTAAEYRSAVASAAACSNDDGPVSFDDETGLANDVDRLETSCVAEHLAGVQEVWRTQVRYLDEDELARIYYTMEGRTDLAAVHEAERGEELILGSGDGWVLRVQERGDGYCFAFWTGGGGTEGCEIPSEWDVPNVLSLSWGMSFGDEPQGEVLGFVGTDAAVVRLSFTSGPDVEVVPFGAETGFGVLGYSYLWPLEEAGALAGIAVLDADRQELGTYDVLAPHCGPGDPLTDLQQVSDELQSDLDAALAAVCELEG